jgi:hypothetical protein
MYRYSDDFEYPYGMWSDMDQRFDLFWQKIHPPASPKQIRPDGGVIDDVAP